MNKQTYTWIIIGILILSAGLYMLLYFSIIQPKVAENKQLEKEISMYSSAIEQFTQEENHDDQGEELSKLKVSIPTEKEPNNVLASINKLASKAGVTVSSIASIEEVEDPEVPLNEAMYSIEVSGSTLSQINSFLDSINESERLMTVETLEINQQENFVSAQLAITSYYSKN